MADHIARRDDVLDALTQELLGPSPHGEFIDCSEEITFEDIASAYRPRRQADSAEEILVRDRPVKRYGVGVLAPPGVPLDEAAPGPAEEPAGDEELASEERESRGESDALLQAGAEELQKAADRVGKETRADDYDFDLATVNAYRPSTMAVSFLVELPRGSRLVVRATGGCYVRKRVRVPNGERTWWLRKAVKAEGVFQADNLLENAGKRAEPDDFNLESDGPLRLQIVAYPRAREADRQTLVTVCLVNRSESEVFDEGCLFQSRFTASVEGVDGTAYVLPYPDPEGRAEDDEEESLDLLYRRYQTFAVGHGCSADWGGGDATRVAFVSAEPLPVFEVPNISADIWLRDQRRKLEVSMGALAGLVEDDDGSASVATLLRLYEEWIAGQWKKVNGSEGHPPLPGRYLKAAKRHLEACHGALGRMRDGLRFLDEDEHARQAFKLANEAVLLQQLRTRREPRRLKYDSATRQLTFEEKLVKPDPVKPPDGRGQWRPFQIAFLLASIRSVADPASTDRKDVELIWFPTGGGKTEAYLGLTAFSLLYRRLKNKQDAGVDVLMRYTLRLLTAQQFQRASALICALDYLRRNDEELLGSEEFSIGLWLGGSVSPNRREDARAALRELRGGGEENKFVVMRCPWCGAQMGQVRYTPRGRRQKTTVCGYTEADGAVTFQCPDPACDFSDRLPIYVVDDEIYDSRPSLVIGTVDKFAQLAWQPKARSLFGLADDGSRMCSPPNLIIQDELHLISGPLGSMVGIYEGAIDALCLSGSNQPPKIISSTATIRRYERQVCDLYARDAVHLFPPSGLDAGDSFFAHFARDEEAGDDLLPGRKFVGIHAPGLGSVQTAQVRTFSALLQAPAAFSVEERDPWWTLMVFFNSLRELGTSLSLLQSDIPDYLWALQNRLGLSSGDSRRLRDFLELTGRLRNDEVPKAMERLEVETTSTGATPVDVCLASNIIEVGIDIDRLSLMCVVGQPKTTSQYIQVTGRVGRRWWERPALVATIYSASKPRDRSHFEKFRSYHERLYAQVEPTSVTPFSPPVLDRALHAVIASFVRQAGPEAVSASPYPFPEKLVEEIREFLTERVAFVDPEEADRFNEVFEKRVTQWKAWQRTTWRRLHRDDDIPLLRQAGAYASTVESQLSWATPNSLRDVDAECEAKITTLYLRAEEDGNV